MIEINLLPSQRVLTQKEKLIRQIMLGSLGILSAVLVVDLLIFFLFQQLFTRQVSDLISVRSNLLAQSEQFTAMALDLRSVEEKTVGIAMVKSLRQDFSTIIVDLQKLLVDGVELTNFRVDATGSVVFSARAKDVDSLGQFIGKINDLSDKIHLSKVNLGGLSQEANSSYLFQLSAFYQLPKEGQ